MKKINKILSSALIFFIAAGSYAQNNVSDAEEISLPDVSTVISGGAPKVGKSAVPDYSKVLPESNRSQQVLPQLPETSDVQSSADGIQLKGDVPQKQIYAEGIAGGGYPGYIIGDFSLYRQSGRNPFRIDFGHETANGYSGNSLTSGFFDRNTYIAARKTFSYEKMELDFTGRYENRANGLQDKCDYISDVAQDKIEGNIDWRVNFNNSFSLNTTINGDWYKRYPVITGDFYKIEDYAASVGIIDFNPKSVFTWKNKKNFYASVLAEYNLEYDTKDSFYDTRAINRGNFGFALGWNNDFVKIYGNSSAIIGNETGNHSVVVPFTAGADFSLKNGLSSRKILISAKGGIDSYLPKVENLERFYKFSAAKVMPAETSDWLGSLDVSIPLKDMFTFNAKGEFRSTAYDNGTYHPVYDIDEDHPDFGQYTYIEDFMTQFNSDVSISFTYKIFNIAAGWKNHWIDIPELCDRTELRLAISVLDKKARFGFDGQFREGFSNSNDKCPEVDLSVFFRLTKAVRLAVSATDVVKLWSGCERDYAGQYIQRSGTASVLVKFFF